VRTSEQVSFAFQYNKIKEMMHLQGLILAYKAGQIQLTKDELEAIRGDIETGLIECFEILKAYEGNEDLQFARKFMPPQMLKMADKVVALSKTELSIDKKIEVLYNPTCNTFISLEFFWLFYEFFFYFIGWPAMGDFCFIMVMVSFFMYMICIIVNPI